MINKILTEDTIRVEVECKNWQEVAQQAGELLVNNGSVTEEYIAATIQTVEKFGPYIILVPDIAFFHAEPNDYVKEIDMSFVTLKSPVYFNENKDNRIKCAFCFAAVDKDSHLQLLADLTKHLKDEKFLSMVKNHPTKEEILKFLK